MAREGDAQLVYDGDCPVCSLYSRSIDIANGKVIRVDAREQCELVDEIAAAGYDLDEGMILKDGSDFYYGSDALHELALRSSGNGVFNRVTASVFRHPRVARIMYPPLTAGRRLLLRILGRSRIRTKE